MSSALEQARETLAAARVAADKATEEHAAATAASAAATAAHGAAGVSYGDEPTEPRRVIYRDAREAAELAALIVGGCTRKLATARDALAAADKAETEATLSDALERADRARYLADSEADREALAALLAVPRVDGNTDTPGLARALEEEGARDAKAKLLRGRLHRLAEAQAAAVATAHEAAKKLHKPLGWDFNPIPEAVLLAAAELRSYELSAPPIGEGWFYALCARISSPADAQHYHGPFASIPGTPLDVRQLEAQCVRQGDIARLYEVAREAIACGSVGRAIRTVTERHWTPAERVIREEYAAGARARSEEGARQIMGIARHATGQAS